MAHQIHGQTRLDFISALRGLAALYVVLLHLTFTASGSVKVPGWLAPAVGFAGTGVILFFVLSAFTLSMSMDARANEQGAIKNFFIRRFFRIAPLFYVSIAVTVGITFLVWGTHPSAVAIGLNLLFLFNLIPGFEWSLAWAGWSIGTEMLFYLLFPLIFATSRTWRGLLAWVVTSLIVASAWREITHSILGIKYPFWYTGVLYHLPDFVFGVAAYHIYVRLKASPFAGRIGVIFTAISIAAMWVMAYLWTASRESVSFYLIPLSCAAFIVGLGLFPFRVLVNRPLMFAGDISYSIYLNHAAACLLVDRVAPTVYARMPIGISFAAMYALLLLIVIPASYLTFRLIEVPGNALGRRIIERARNAHAAPAEAAAPPLAR